jgi:isoleucyl-tRNA synthetase
VRQALAGQAAGAAQAVLAGEPVRLDLDGETVELAPEDILVQSEPTPGLAVAADRLATVAVDTHLTAELRAEGLAREVVRRVQAMRKEAGFNLDDRIRTTYAASGELAEVIAAWAGYLCAETLTVELFAGEPPEDAFVQDHTVEGAAVRLGVVKAND